MDYTDSDTEYQTKDADDDGDGDDDDDGLPEIPLIISANRKRSADSVDRLISLTPPKSQVTLPETIVTSPLQVSPARPISRRAVYGSLQTTQQHARRVHTLNVDCAEHQESRRKDSIINDVIKNGGFVQIEEERQKRLLGEKVNCQSIQLSELRAGLPLKCPVQPLSKTPVGVPYFTDDPELMFVLSPPELEAPLSKMEQTLCNADHPQLNELVQGNLICFGYEMDRKPVPRSVQEWLFRVACLFNDTQLSHCACRTLCSLVTKCSHDGWELTTASLLEILQKLGVRNQHTTEAAESDRPLSSKSADQNHTGYDEVGPSPRRCIAPQLRNLAIIIRVLCQHRIDTLKEVDETLLLSVLFRAILDPQVLCKPIENDLLSTLDIFVSKVPEANLKPAAISLVQDLLPLLKDPWDKMYIAQMLAMMSGSGKTLRGVFCIACLKMFIGNQSCCCLSTQEHVTRQLPNIGALSLNELYNSSFVKVFCSFLVVYLEDHAKLKNYEAFYPIFQVFWIACRLVPYNPAHKTDVLLCLEKLNSVYVRVKDSTSTVWPSIFKDLVFRIIGTVRPDSSLLDEVLS